MQRILLAVPFLLACSVGCRHGAPRSDEQADASAADLTSATIPSPSDEEIVTRIQDAILKSHAVEPQSGDVHATSSAGIVTLQGRVGTDSAKRRIHDLALHTPGVKSVIDELDAPEPNPSPSNDVAITDAIRGHLAAHQADNVKVTTIDAKVVLEGSVPTETEKKEIQRLAERTPNVATIDNRILVRPLSKP